MFRFNHDEKTENKINDIIGSLTIQEKIRLLSGDNNGRSTHAIKAKGIPQFKMSDGPSGIHWWTENSVTYPALIAAAATWDTELIEQMGLSLGRDAKQRGVQILLAPGVNIYRSPLCGRNFEYFGEDPYLSSQMAKAYIIGVQKTGVAATVKHFALNFQEYNRHNVSSDVDERTLHEIYLPAFKSAVIEAQAGAVMTAYNLVNGIHCSEHKELIIDILKTKWHFQGLVMSDWVSVYSDSAAAEAGLDLEMPDGIWFNEEKLLPLIQEGKLQEKIIDDKIRRLLRLGFQFGWMNQKDESASINNDREASATALEVAKNSIVLLKNKDSILPLNAEKIKSIAVIGPNSHPAVISGGGSAFNTPPYQISLYEGIQEFTKNLNITVKQTNGLILSREWETAETSIFITDDGQQGLKGEYFNNQDCTGLPVLTKIDKIINFQWGHQPPFKELTTDFYSVRWKGKIIPDDSGIYRFYIKENDSRYKVWIDNELFFDNWLTEEGNTKIIDKELKEGKSYSIKIEYAKTRVWASLSFGYEKKDNAAFDLQKSLDIAAEADIVILAAGFNEKTESEGFDRSFELPENQSEFIRKIAEKNQNIIVVLNAGGGVEMDSWIHSVKSVLHSWYLGQETGRALSEILFGKTAPSGKLPITIEKKLEDNASFHSYHDKNNSLHVNLKEGIFTGYRHFDKNNIKPLFPFGFGLSYTEFEYSDFQLSQQVMKADEKINISFSLKNTGKYDGAEIIQLYITDTESSLERPKKELKHFQKIFLKQGEMKHCIFEIDIHDLKFYNPDIHDWTYEKGEFQIHIGRSSRDILFSGGFILE